MAKIDVKFMKGDRQLAKAMGATYTKKSGKAKSGSKSNTSKKK